MAESTRTVFELRAGGLEASDLRVRRLWGRERLSAPYAFEVEFDSARGEFLAWREQLGAEGRLTLRRRGGFERSVHGVLWRVELTGVSAGQPHYRVRLGPRLERLRWVKRSRVFQNLSVPQIVGQVLDEHQVQHRQALAAGYPARESCLQLQESDLEFVSRLLESEGIGYWFEHGPDRHVLVLADAAGGYAELTEESAVACRVEEPLGDGAGDEQVWRLEGQLRLRPGKVSLRDYDFERPEMEVDGSRQAESGAELEVYSYPGDFLDPRAGPARAQRHLEELRFGAETWSGQSNCLGFFPGAAFPLQGQEDSSYNHRLRLVEVRHEGQQQQAAGAGEVVHRYRNQFTALESSVPYRPRRRTGRPLALPQTARVVGPAGEEVYVDRYGRVKVQFHWDREGQADEQSSCWVRLAQCWSGAAWGASWVPRIGQEVLIKFYEGDPDRPLVAGAVYNGQNRPPVELPLDKSRSTLKSDSSPQGGGNNELRLEDLAGGEEISLHAQKDETLQTQNDKGQRVGGHEALQVAKDRAIEVQGQQRLAVEQDEHSSIGVEQTLTVSGERVVEVGGDQGETVGLVQTVSVGGQREVTVGAASVQTVGAAAALSIGAGYAVNVGGVENVAVGGALLREVGGAHLEYVGAAREERVAGDASAQVGGDCAVEVQGQVTRVTEGDQQEQVAGRSGIAVQGAVSLGAQEVKWQAGKLSLVVGGQLALSIDRGGAIRFYGSRITVNGEQIALQGSQVKKVAAGAAPSAAAQVPQLQGLDLAPATARIVVRQVDGHPVVNARWRAELPGGGTRTGRTNAHGEATIPSPRSGDIRVTLLDLDADSWRHQ